MNQQVDNAIGGFDVAEKYRAHSVGGTTQYSEPSDSVETYQTSRDGLGDSCEHGNKPRIPVRAINTPASRLLNDSEIKALLRPNAEPRPEAERRVYPIENHGKDKPFNHADRRRAE
jgi:hypothetical protein